MKTVHSKLIANINLNHQRKEIQSNSNKSRKEGCPLSPYLFNIVLEIIARAVRKLKVVKGILIRKEQVKLYFLHKV